MSTEPVDPDIVEIVQSREIEEVLHFTTRRGVLGVLASGYLKARTLLDADDYLEHIYTQNAPDRSRDSDWLSYVSLSITNINYRFFQYSGRWHAPDMWWAVLAFDPVVLAHPGVVFVTTNNAYHDCAVRAEGAQGLESLFAEAVREYVDRRRFRHGKMPNQPTCVQAEALYPEKLSTEFLRRVYVADSEHASMTEAWCASLNHSPLEIIVDPEVFRS